MSYAEQLKKISKTIPDSDKVLDMPIRMRDVPKIIFKLTGVKLAKCTINRWAREGLMSCSGKRVKLKTRNWFGGSKLLITTRRNIEKFLEDLET